MNINNLEYSPPSNIRNMFYNYIPFGSDYVIFTSQYGTGSNYTRKYDLYVHKLGQKVYKHYQATQTTNGTTFSTLSDGDYDSFVTAEPFYAYSNVAGTGIQESTLPCVNNTICFMLVILASVAVIKLVFGGIKFCLSRKRDIYS